MVRLDGQTGSPRWTFDGGAGTANAVVMEGNDVIAAGTLGASCGGPPGGVVRLAGVDGAAPGGTQQWTQAFL